MHEIKEKPEITKQFIGDNFVVSFDDVRKKVSIEGILSTELKYPGKTVDKQESVHRVFWGDDYTAIMSKLFPGNTFRAELAKVLAEKVENTE